MQELKALKSWVTPYEELRQGLEGALEMAQLLEIEPDESMQAEVTREAKELADRVEA